MVTKSDDFGNSVIINLHKEVTFLGIADYIAQKPYQSNAIALEDSTVCILKHEVVQDFMVTNKAFNSSLLGSLSAQFHQSNNRLLVATKKQMSSRLADGLLELKRVFGTTPSGHLNVYLKRAELAILCNMSIANIIRQLSSFDKNEIIKLEGKKILISNENLLLKESETA
jgi:CRP-like cAMP-binding protein